MSSALCVRAQFTSVHIEPAAVGLAWKGAFPNLALPLMLKPHEIFARMPPAVGESLFSFLMEKEHALYKTTIDTLAKQRKLRTIFVERKPKIERNAWLKEVVGKKVNAPIAAHLLQIWLVGAHARDSLRFFGCARNCAR